MFKHQTSYAKQNSNYLKIATFWCQGCKLICYLYASIIWYNKSCFWKAVSYFYRCTCLGKMCMEIVSFCWYSGADPAGGAPGAPAPSPLKLEKNMIFWRKIVIFHTKYLGSAPDIGGIVDHYCLIFLFIEKPRIEVESSYNTFTNRCTNIEWYKMRNRIINIRRRLTWKRTRLSLSLYKKSI